MKLLHKLEGCVVDINEDSFYATLVDLTDPKQPDTGALFSIKDISDEEMKYLAREAVFTLYVYEKPNPPTIIFNKDVWKKEELDQASEYAKELKEFFT